jgi:hypothetical protein
MIAKKKTSLLSACFLGSLIILSVVIGCQKKGVTTTTKEQSNNLPEHPVFNKNVGGPIDSGTANQWKRNLLAKLRKNKSTAAFTTVYYLPASTLQQLIHADNAVGVCFYYGQNDQGQVFLVPIGVDKRGYVMPASTVNTTHGLVSWQVATSWRQQFKINNPSGTWGYFWGSVAINRLIDQGTEEVRINLGLDDNGLQRIMFSDAAVAEPTYYEDRTGPCPSFCPADLEIDY